MKAHRWLLSVSQIFAVLCRCILDLAAAGLLIMTVVIGWQVFGRYVLNASPAWSETLALILMLYYVLFAAAVGVRQGFHLGLRIMVDNLPIGIRAWAVSASLLLVVLFGALMAINGVRLAAYTANHVVPTLGINRSVAYWPFAVSGVLMVIFALERIAVVFYGELEGE